MAKKTTTKKTRLTKKGRPDRRAGPKTKEERDARRNWLVEQLWQVDIHTIYKVAGAKFGVGRETIRRDLRWAAERVNDDFSAACSSEPVRLYQELEHLAATFKVAAEAEPVLAPDGKLLFFKDKDGKERPLIVANHKAAAIVVKARDCQKKLLGYRGTDMWQQRLRAQELRLIKARADMAEQEVELADRDAEIRKKQQEMKEGGGAVAGHVQQLESTERRMLTRAALLGKLELSSVLSRFARSREGTQKVSVDVDVSVTVEGVALRGEQGF